MCASVRACMGVPGNEVRLGLLCDVSFLLPRAEYPESEFSDALRKAQWAKWSMERWVG